MTDTQVLSNSNKDKLGNLNPHEFKLWKPILAFVLFAFVISLAGSMVFQSFKERIKSDRRNELSGITDLKIGQITNWMRELKGNAQAIKNDYLFVEDVDRWLRQGGHDVRARQNLEERLTLLHLSNDVSGYAAISLFDNQAVLRLSTSKDEVPIQGTEKALLLESMRSGKIAVSDIHREKRRSGEAIEIELCAPLTLVKNGRLHKIGAILFHINPYDFLFPLVQRWPTSSASAESCFSAAMAMRWYF